MKLNMLMANRLEQQAITWHLKKGGSKKTQAQPRNREKCRNDNVPHTLDSILLTMVHEAVLFLEAEMDS
jgi:hypothetical protein